MKKKVDIGREVSMIIRIEANSPSLNEKEIVPIVA